MVQWDGGGGDLNWNNALNWDTNALPGAADDVQISIAGANTILHSTGTTTINSLTCDESLTISGASFTLAASSTILGGLNLQGAILSGSGALTVSGLTTWSSGSMTGTGTLTAVGGMSIEGAASRIISGKLIKLTGGGTWSGGDIDMDDGAVLEVSTGQTLQATGNNQIKRGTGTGTATIINLGTIAKSGGTGTTTFANNVTFANAAAVVVQAGSLALNVGATHSGTFSTTQGATLQFAGAGNVFDGNSSITGQGNVNFAGGSATINGAFTPTGSVAVGAGAAASFNNAITLSTLTVAGTFQTQSAVSVLGDATWTGGSITGAGAFNVSGSLAISTASGKILKGKIVGFLGGGTWSGGDIDIDDGAVLEVSTGQTLQISGNNQIKRGTGTGAASVVVQAGATVQKSSVGTTLLAPNVSLTNNGSIQVGDGILSVQDVGFLGGEIAIDDGAFRFDGGVYTVGATVAITGTGKVEADSGTITFNGAISSGGNGQIDIGLGAAALLNSNVSNAALTLAGTATTFAGATLSLTAVNLSGTLHQNGASFTVSNALQWTAGLIDGPGSIATKFLTLTTAAVKRLEGPAVQVGAGGAGGGSLTSGDLQLDSGAALQFLAGTVFSLQSDASIVRNTFVGSASVSNAGTFRKTAGVGTSAVGAGVDFANSGAVQVQTGQLTLAGGFSNFAGTTLTGGTYTVTGTLSFVGANIITNAANITLVGLSAAIRNSVDSSNALADFAINSAGALFALQGGANLAVSGSLTNAGTLSIASGSTLTAAGGNIIQTNGVSTVNGIIDPVGILDLQAGVLNGSGTIQATTVVSGVAEIEAGNSPGALTIDGSLQFNAGTIVRIDLDGLTPATTYDLLNVNGTVDLSNAQLEITRRFGANLGDTFTILNSLSPTIGQFVGIPNLGSVLVSGTTYQINYLAGFGSTSVELKVLAPDLLPPAVLDVVDVAPDPRMAPVQSVDVDLSELINLASFTIADISLFRDFVPITLFSGNETVAFVSGTTYRISGLAEETAAAGFYQLTVHAAGIVDFNGNAGLGSASDDWLNNLPPTVTAMTTPSSPRNAPLPFLEVTFSELLQMGSFTFVDCTLTRNGGPNLLTPGQFINQPTPGVPIYRMNNLLALTAPNGNYVFTVHAAGVLDQSGLPGVGSFAVAWTMDTIRPTSVDIVDVVPDPRRWAVSTIDIVLSERVSLASFTAADCILTLNAGPNLLTGAEPITYVGGTTYRIGGLSGLTAADGDYTFTVDLTGILDDAGNIGLGSDFDVWTVDTLPPIVLDVLDVSPDPRNVAVATIDIQLSEIVNLATFTVADCILTRNGGPNLLTGTESITYLGGTTYRINGLTSLTGIDGLYSFTVSAAGVEDLAGNAGATTASDAWTMDTLGPSVTGVYFDGSAWTNAFRAAAGNPAHGYPAQTGVGQLTPMPWSTINTLYVTFSEAVSALNVGQIGVRGIVVPNYGIASVTMLNPTTARIQLTINNFDTDRLLVDLDGDSGSAIADAVGNKLVGSWIESTSTFPTTGANGVDFQYRFAIAVGDASRNGTVRNVDLNLVRDNLFVDVGAGGYSIFTDIDGNGLLRNADLNFVRNHLFIDVPAGPGPVRPGTNSGSRRSGAAGYNARASHRHAAVALEASASSILRRPGRSNSVPAVHALDELFSRAE